MILCIRADVFCVFADLLWMIFVSIFDEDLVEEEVFLQWKCSEDPANQTGKDAALKSVSTFFAQLQAENLEKHWWSVISL